MTELDVRLKHNQAPGEDYFRRQSEDTARSGTGLATTAQASTLDGEAARAELRKLLEWYYFEKEKQSTNRLEMSMDADFYDGMQWDPEDAGIVRERGQMPLVYNEVATMIDWLIGTERRTRVDWRVLPRTEDDVEMADTKTKVLKYVSDINRVSFTRSRAFTDAVKVGVGWLDDGTRDDPTQDILYSKYEDWRSVLWDSSSYELDLSDARYVFRWRWVDEDIAKMMFPHRQDAIASAVEESAHYTTDGWEEDSWYTTADASNLKTGTLYASGVGQMADAKRRRVKLIECQYRKPTTVKVVADGQLKGLIFNEGDATLAQAIAQSGSPIVDKVMMRVHVAVFTEAAMLGMSPSVFRHNRFSLTPIWCYRRGRDRLPYGALRRVRDIQSDLNKRASKAQFLVNTNQVIADEGAVDNIETLREEANRPDGVIIKKPGRDVTIRRDTDAAAGQIQMMSLATNAIQRSVGVADENMGRQTNAVSGEAIKARQLQGSVVTTEPFDNLRFATQIQGEKQLSLCEQYYTQEKVIRLTGAKGALEWVRINTPEMQTDGTVRYINDITSSAADFVVSEADYAGTLRQVMFDSLNAMANRAQPEMALRLLTIAMDFSDLPNKDEVANQIRKLTGERDASKPMSPEEAQQAEQQMQAQAEALQMQRESAKAALDEQLAKVREINARAAKLEADAMAAGQQGGDNTAMKIRSQLSDEMDRMSQELRKAQGELANRTLQIRSDADAKREAAHIEADTKIRVAEIQAASNERIKTLEERLAAIEQGAQTSLAAGRVQAGGRSGQAGQGAGPAAVVLQVTGDVSVQTDATQIDAPQAVNVQAQDTNIAAQEAQVQTASAQISTDGDVPVQVAGDLKADKTHVTMQMPAPQPAPAKSIVVTRDKSGRISGAQISESAEAGAPNS